VKKVHLQQLLNGDPRLMEPLYFILMKEQLLIVVKKPENSTIFILGKLDLGYVTAGVTRIGMGIQQGRISFVHARFAHSILLFVTLSDT